jgi:hypothetical protein
MSKAIYVFQEMHSIKLLEGDVWGHRMDLDEYFTVEDADINEIRTITASGSSMDDIISLRH